ncbi:GILT family protein [Aspergillus lucknowensis]|uniref:Gamma interferon inducible lysosomal thiol reductase n=1 Tax=Aspergillus lucknowensis TaxID=176173 RepID=A0ABR4LD13_9EURO
MLDSSSAMEKQAERLYCRDRLPRPVSQSITRRHRSVNLFAGLLGLISGIWLGVRWLPIVCPKIRLPFSYNHAGLVHDGNFFGGGDSLADSEPIPFEAHIMSKCPDARDCLRELVVPTMEQVGDKVDFELSFIANVSNKSSDVECMHGPTECIGDMLMLCAANLPFAPEGSVAQVSGSRTPPVRYLGFSNCLISSYTEIPDRTLVEQCALEYGIDFDALNECVSQQDDNPNHGNQGEPPLSGVALLRESARHSAELGVRTSCTVRLDDNVWCIRDGGVWKDCAREGEGSQVSVLVEEIKKLWKQRN